MSPYTHLNDFMYQNTPLSAPEVSTIFMGNHKGMNPPLTLQSIEINTKLKGKVVKCTV